MSSWWSESTFYQVYMPSFCDGNGDGMGDFLGLTAKLDYLQGLGAEGIWITPFYPSPMVDNGYDVSDHCNVDPKFGSLDDFDFFVEQAHARGIKVIVDIVLNHVSSEHPWFTCAKGDPKSHYRDYFFFADEPNNWESFFGGSAWTHESEVNGVGEQFYYHKFSPKQVDLNWTNPRVIEEAKKIFDFWINRGVDGFRLDVINFLSTKGICEDNPCDKNNKQEHTNDIDQPGIHEAINDIATYIHQKGDYFVVGEVGSDNVDKLADYRNNSGLDVVFNFNLGSLETFDVSEMMNQIKLMEEKQSGLATLFFSSHDMPRMISRFGEDVRDVQRAKAISVLQLSAKGIPFIYQGEEFGFPDYLPDSLEDIHDVQGLTHYKESIDAGMDKDDALKIAIEKSRDKSRYPIRWDDSEFGGFSTHRPWLYGKSNEFNVNARDEMKNKEGLYQHYRSLIDLRKNNVVLRKGEYKEITTDDDLVYILRHYEESLVGIYINFSNKARLVAIPLGAEVIFGKDFDHLDKNEFVIFKL
ncbi:glucohydrolase [Photobacterium gaetbulicola]|uniref:Putative trehalose-6-phosphate hydrolase n=1 Tax=Photobacterium gaetbulicola Gung47 TaxID=658445 RepID=A0A0C5WST7_9GAMM|nr:alpha-amylase family glycosyl hydrolase [Photobacterium gaetbulicola]AJR09472.1 putative trehalose-6-phosphate hydrolase [Photobacterium gaetbulicola Gung47]PSU14419.1 glucohydrolase [Photobacterium gaetbulicola]